jgi:hypothetical protein
MKSTDVPEVGIGGLFIRARVSGTGDHHIELDANIAEGTIGISCSDLPECLSRKIHAAPPQK